MYRWRKRYLAYGRDGLYPAREGGRRRPPELCVRAERTLLDLAWPTWVPVHLALQLRRLEHGDLHVAPFIVYRLLPGLGLQTRWQPLAVLEAHSAQAADLLTERSRRRMTDCEAACS
ncbi:MAG: hypothetical protein ABSB61_10260 [Anaerolineales bacterium]|jgi:hypothetical protein